MKDEKCELEIILEAIHIRVCNNERLHSLVDEQARIEFEQFWLEHEERPLAGIYISPEFLFFLQ
jgi:hypothetical protein